MYPAAKKCSVPLILLLITTVHTTHYASETKHVFKKIYTYREVQNVFDACNKNTLVTFDVDDTLITARDVLLALDRHFPLLFIALAVFKHPSLLFKNQFRLITSKILQQAQQYVFDPDIVHIIKQLQERECPVIALTLMRTGSCGEIKSLPAWRTSMLKSFGLDFSDTFANVCFTSFLQFRSGHPCLYQGVLCTNMQPKGKVLRAFLEHYHLRPERIISFDDRLESLNSIASACANMHVTHVGYHMLGAKKLRGAWNQRRALFQIDYVMKHGRWLSDQEADTLLAHKTTLS